MSEEKEMTTDEDLVRLFQQARPPIDWNPKSFASIATLNLPECGLSSLPCNLGSILPNLSILFCPKNNFEELPAVIGSCPKLQMVSFKSNGMKRIHPDALQPQMRWLILTDNSLESLPSTIGRCGNLQKLMLSGNRLTGLPDEISNCHGLELVRLASNQLEEPPLALLKLPKLAWAAFSDNPFLDDCTMHADGNSLPLISDYSEGDILGQGASGVTRLATLSDQTQVAIKTYIGTMTSDGNPQQERQLSLAASFLQCNCLIQVLGVTSEGSLVMELLENYTVLASPPSMESCSRDVYDDDNGANVSLTLANTMVTGLLDALVKLHAQGICHGDFYGHNILVSTHQVKLSDFGAAFAYDTDSEYARWIERIEMRAFGYLVEEIEMLLSKKDKVQDMSERLFELAGACRDESNSFKTLQEFWEQGM